MRYQIGEKLIVVHFHYETDRPQFRFTMPYLYSEEKVKEIQLCELEVTEHHKVSWEYDTDNKNDCDGYVLKDKDGNTWHNQYPKASYGQTTAEGDFRFRRSLSEAVGDEMKNPTEPVDYRLLTQVYDDIYSGIEQLSKKEDPPVQLIQKLTEVKEQLEKQVGEQFKKKFVSITYLAGTSGHHSLGTSRHSGRRITCGMKLARRSFWCSSRSKVVSFPIG